MKNQYLLILLKTRLLLLCGVLILPTISFAQLSGKYTIDPTKSASSTNYRNWASAIGDLTSGSRNDGGLAQGSGVGGAVVITVYDSIYTNTPISIGAISGASASNTITFTSASGDSTKCVLSNPSSTSSSNDYTLQLNGADFVTFEGIGFERTGSSTYATVVNITNDADNNTLKNCWMKGIKMNSTSSLGFTYGVGSVIYFTGNGDNNTVENSKLIYGYNGVFCTSSSSNNLFLNNTIDTSGSSGFYMTNQTGLKIIGNTLWMGDFGPNKGHYVSYGMRIESSPSMLISKNRVHMLATNGQVVRAIMLANTTSTQSSPTLVNNNWVVNSGGTGDCTGLAVYACNYVDFYYNNILITNSIKSGAAYYHYAQYSNTYINLVNNNLINKGGGYVYNVPGSNTSDLAFVNYNNLYSNGTNIANWAGSDYTSFSAYKTASGNDSVSINSDPGFVSVKDLHVSNIGLNGMALPYSFVSDDIDGETRSSTTPDIGADEFFPAQYDAGISDLDSPAAFCSGTYNVKVSFSNYGIDTLTDVEINWAVNGQGQKKYTWSGKLAPGKIASSIALGNYSFSTNQSYTFKIWTSNPNKSNDGKPINDTLVITRSTGLSGTYTIGASGNTDYKSFNDAITDITSRGICGPTTFNVADGVYNEQITLTQLGGVSAANPLVFQGASKDSTKVVLTLPSTTATGNNNAVLQLRGADYTTFRFMTFQRTGTNPYAQVIHVLGESNNNTFTNCQMIATQVTTANASGVNIWSDQSQDIGNVFRNNYIKNGTYCIQYTGFSSFPETGTVIENNIFDSAYTSSVDIAYNDGLVFRNNEFRNVRSSTSGNFDLQLLGCDSSIMIMGNRFLSNNTEIAFILNECYGTASSRGTIANNLFPRVNGVGILLDGVEYENIIFNSMNFTGTTATNAGVQSSTTRSRYNILKNNCIVMNEGFALDMNAANNFQKSDFNNLFTQGSSFVKWGSNTYGGLGGLRNTAKTDSNSISVNPLYTSATDLHAKNPSLNGLAESFKEVTVDMDGQARDATPDVGADEFPLSPDDGGISALIAPVDKNCSGDLSVVIALKNYGGNALTSATINWSIGGSTQTPYSWTGSLNTRDTAVIAIGKFKFQGNTQPKIVIWTTSPNGKSDAFSGNDSIEVSRLIIGVPPAAAGVDEDVCMGDSVEIGTSPNSIYDYEWFDANDTLLSTQSKVWVKPTSTSEYYIKVTDNAFNCANTDTLIVTVNANPVPGAGSDQTICKGESTKIGGGSTIGNSYEWISSPSGTATSAAQPTVSPDQTTSYYLTETVDATGCSSMDTMVVTVLPLPTPQIAGDTLPCHLSTYSYQTTDVNGHTYEWRTTGGTVSTINTHTTDVTWSTLAIGTIELVETSVDGCKDSITVNIDVQGLPTAKMEFDIGCATKPIAFRDVSQGTVQSFWDFGNGNTDNLKNTSQAFAKDSQYMVTLVAIDDNGCRDSVNRVVDILPLVESGFSIDDPTCVNSEFTINNTSSGATASKWSLGDGNSSTDESPKVTYSQAKAYTLKLVASNDGCADSIIKAIRVFDLPNADFTGDVFRDSIEFSPKIKGMSYSWDFGDGESSEDESPIHEYNKFRENVTATLTVTDENGCVNTSSQSFYIDISSVGDVNGLTNLSLYPNPAASQTTLEIQLDRTSLVGLRILDMNGKQLKTLAQQNLNSGTSQLDLTEQISALETGTYLIELNVNNQVTHLRLIKL